MSHVLFQSSVAEGAQEDRPRLISQLSTAHRRDEGRTQSGGVKGVIAPASDRGMLNLTPIPTMNISRLRGVSFDLTSLYSNFHIFHRFFFCFTFFSTSRVSILRTAFGQRAIVVYVCSAFIWT